MSDNKFISGLKSMLNAEKIATENSARAYKTSGSALVDVNFSVSELRGATVDVIEEKFSKAFFESPELAMRWLFFSRDIRQGLGERRLFRVCLSWLVTTCPDAVRAVIPLVGEYGRFDDLLVLNNTCVWDDVMSFISKQLREDVVHCSGSKPVSLLAKWLPSCNTSSAQSRHLAMLVRTSLGMNEREYRKTLSKLRKWIDVVEVKTSANDWGKIDYEKVPSKANLKYKDAFLRHDAERRSAYLIACEKGDAKINSAASFPCDIVAKYMKEVDWNMSVNSYDATIEAMWKALPDYVMNADDVNTICVADGSGSMTSYVSGKMTALDVANSLAIYFAERLAGPFKDKYITFSARPQYVDMSNASTLHSKLMMALTHNECASTNIEATFDLILDTAMKNGLKQEDIPNILILSDMNFDQGVHLCNDDVDSLMDEIAKKWETYGYNLPRVTYWNICGGTGRTGPIPMQVNSAGITLVSGFSPTIASMVFSQKTTPYEVLVEKLMTKRYDAVANAVMPALKKI